MQTVLDTRELRNAFGRFATGVTVVSYLHGGQPHGLTVNSFTSVSMDPPLALVSIANTAASAGRLRHGRFAVNILGEDQHPHALQFSGRVQESFTAEWINPPDGGAPEIAGAVAVLQLETAQIIPAGDHDIHLGAVRSIRYDDGSQPLLFIGGRFARVGEYQPRTN